MKFKHKMVALFALAIAVITAVIGSYAVYNMKSKVLEAAREKLLSDSAMGLALLDQNYPGEWLVKDDALYKGEVKLNDNFELVDEIGRLTGDTVTIFQGDTRISTNVKDESGKRAVNTKVSDAVS